MKAPHVLDEFQSLSPWHGEVGQNHLWLKGPDCGEGTRRIFGLTADDQVGLLLNEPDDSIPSHRMVVHNQYSGPHLSG